MPANVEIPDKAKSGGELIIKADNADSLLVVIYESPRQRYSDEDKDQKNPLWRGDVFELSHSEDFQKDGIHIKLKRGPNSRPAVYGNYLVKVYNRKDLSLVSEKIVEIEHVHQSTML